MNLMLGLLTRPERRHLSHANILCQHLYKGGRIVQEGSFWHKMDVFPVDFHGSSVELHAALHGKQDSEK